MREIRTLEMDSEAASPLQDQVGLPAGSSPAVVGATRFRKVLLASLELQGRKDLEAFDTEVEALAWLASR